MRFLPTVVAGAFVVEPTPHVDARGQFMRAWCAREFAEQGIAFVPVQANMGFSHHKGTLRGMHFQRESAPEAKLVRCTRGSMFDVVVDVRKDSETFGKWFGVELSPENGKMLYLPEGCAHGYQTLTDQTEMHYMASAYFTPSAATGVRFDDPQFKVQWPLPAGMMSEQDLNWPRLP